MERVFPAGNWTAGPDGDGLAAKWLRLAAAPPAWRERLGAPRRAPERGLVRMLRSLRSGILAETGGIQPRADFYFETACRELERLCANARLCNALSASCGGLDIRAAAAHELFFQTHVGFIHGYQRLNGAVAPGHRVMKHAAWAERALKFAGMTAVEESAARAWLRSLEIAALQRAGRQDEALSAFERALEHPSPDHFKDAYVQALYDLTTGALNEGESDDQKQKNGETLAGALMRFRRVFDTLSDRPLAWERLAQLYCHQIGALSDGEAPGSRIAILQRAVDADPFNLATHSLDVQSRFALAESQEAIARIEAEAAAEGKVLNEKGLSLKNSVMNGFVEARTYLKSEAAAAAHHAARTEWARTVRTGLSLTDTDAPQQRLDLMDAIGAALVRCELDAPTFAATLADELSARPDLHDLDASFIATRLVELKGAPPQPAVHVEPVVPGIIQASQPLTVAEDRAVPGAEDLADWLFSGQGLITRWSMAAATVLVMTAAGLTGYNIYVESHRQTLFPRVMAAARDTDYEAVADLAAQFLSRRPLNGREHLDRAVEQVYAEALVNWFAQSTGEPSPSLLRAAQNYRELVDEPKEERP